MASGAQGQGQKHQVGRAWSLMDVVRTTSQWAILPGAGNFSCQVQPSQELCPTSGSVAALWPWGVGGIGQDPRTRGPTDMGSRPHLPDCVWSAHLWISLLVAALTNYHMLTGS